ERVISGPLRGIVGISYFSTKWEDIKECDAPKSKSTEARADWTRNSPKITPGASTASSAYTWFTFALPKDCCWLLAGAVRLASVGCFGPCTELEKTEGAG